MAYANSTLGYVPGTSTSCLSDHPKYSAPGTSQTPRINSRLRILRGQKTGCPNRTDEINPPRKTRPWPPAQKQRCSNEEKRSMVRIEKDEPFFESLNEQKRMPKNRD